jgi:hypothetical protein
MSQTTLELLAQQAAAGDPAASAAFLARLDAILRPLNGAMLDKVAWCALALKDQRADQNGPAQHPAPIPATGADAASIPSGVVTLTPEQLEWYRQQINEEEVVATLRDLRANGGLSSEELLSVLDDEASRP